MKKIALLLLLAVALSSPAAALNETEEISSGEMLLRVIVPDPRVMELADYPTWEEGLQHLIDTWPSLQEFLEKPDALEAIVRAYHSIMTPKRADTQEEKVRLLFLELLLERETPRHNIHHSHHSEGIEDRARVSMIQMVWDKYFADYEKEYFIVWPEHGVRQDQIPFFYSAYPAMAYRVAIERGYQSKRESIVPPGRAEDMSTKALVQCVVHSPSGVKIWNNNFIGQMSGYIITNWYYFVRENDAARELMMFREDAAREILRYYQSIHLTDESFEQFMTPLTVCEIFLRQEFVSSKLSAEELAERDTAFADKFIEKLRYREHYSVYRIPQWIAYEDMCKHLEFRRNGRFYISEFEAMPFLALQVMKRAI